MDQDDLDIPDFLRLSPEERKAAWERQPPKPLDAPNAGSHPFRLPKSIEPEGLRMFEEEERECERKKAERLAALKKLPRKPARATRKKSRAIRQKGKTRATRNRK